ncbi:DMT family transporter [Portibacter lacus]|uniref:Membrane protein n=1 Tax=Portibacter lacus TaxID=1099794 RepID=A0AA37WEN1_9BACT|nr:DMT family transporter [Portibacter lacus]GLR17592.1 membrane protein [Portibacter lacus]
MKKKSWLLFAYVTMITWGVWGAFTNLPTEYGFPETMIYVVWALTMIIPAIIVLKMNNWKLEVDKKAILYGSLIGLLGAGGQMILFHAVKVGPPYLIFPIISLSPIITIGLSFLLLKERTGWIGTAGIVLALIALPMFELSGDFSFSNPFSSWFFLAVLVLMAWGLQAFFMKKANEIMQAESIFFYMMIWGILLIPFALYMTDFDTAIFSTKGISLAAGIQVLNAIGALFLVYAFRYGKAIVVSPLTNAGAPLITAIISLIVLSVVPSATKIIGIVLAVLAALLISLQPEEKKEE